MAVQNHWGVWIDTDQPIGGVVSIHSVEWINEECDNIGNGDSIDLSYEGYVSNAMAEKLAEWAAAQENIYHEGGPAPAAQPSPELIEQWEYEIGDQYDNGGESQYLIGNWIKDDDGKYAPDKTGEYAAIVSYDSFMCCQVVWSIYATRCNLCSPCFAGQGDLDRDGQYLAYDLPLDLYGGSRQNPNAQITLIAPGAAAHDEGAA